MQEVIKISDKEIVLSNNISWALEYRDQFGKDVLQEHIPLLATISDTIASVIAENGEEVSVRTIMDTIQGRSYELLIPLMQAEFMTTIINVTWAMAKAYDDNILPPKQWIKQFDEFPLDVIVPKVYGLMLKGFVSSKNLTRLTRILDDLRGASQPKA